MGLACQIQHYLNLRSNIVSQILLNYLLVAHALETVQEFRLDMPGYQSYSDHATADDLADLVVAYLSVDLLLLLRVFSSAFSSFFF